MGKHSRQYLDHAWSIDGHDWRPRHAYVCGVRVFWRGIRLFCTRDHYAGDRATHPWDPGDGWPPEKAANLWAPDGEVELAKLRLVWEAAVRTPDKKIGARSQDGNTRFAAVLYHAAGRP